MIKRDIDFIFLLILILYLSDKLHYNIGTTVTNYCKKY